MFRLFMLTVPFLSLAGLPSDARAQDKPTVPTCDVVVPSEECWKEFEKWQKKYDSWREWKNQFGNRATDERGRRIDQPESPAPPLWVWQCYDLKQAGSPVGSPICNALQTYLEYDWTQHLTGFHGAIHHHLARAWIDALEHLLEQHGKMTNIAPRSHFAATISATCTPMIASIRCASSALVGQGFSRSELSRAGSLARLCCSS